LAACLSEGLPGLYVWSDYLRQVGIIIFFSMAYLKLHWAGKALTWCLSEHSAEEFALNTRAK